MVRLVPLMLHFKRGLEPPGLQTAETGKSIEVSMESMASPPDSPMAGGSAAALPGFNAVGSGAPDGTLHHHPDRRSTIHGEGLLSAALLESPFWQQAHGGSGSISAALQPPPSQSLGAHHDPSGSERHPPDARKQPKTHRGEGSGASASAADVGRCVNLTTAPVSSRGTPNIFINQVPKQLSRPRFIASELYHPEVLNFPIRGAPREGRSYCEVVRSRPPPARFNAQRCQQQRRTH